MPSTPEASASPQHGTRDPDLSLLALLSVVAGLVDVLGFLRLHVFTAHITGNLVLIADQVANGGSPQVAQLIAVPVFAVTVLAACVLARVTGAAGSRAPLLVAQSLLLLLVLGLALHARKSPAADSLTPAILVAVTAMAIQNAFLRVSLHGTATTSAMTGNVATVTIALATLVLGGPWPTGEASQRLRKTLPLLSGFLIGCALGASVSSRFGEWAWAVPVVLSLVAIPLGSSLPSAQVPMVTRPASSAR